MNKQFARLGAGFLALAGGASAMAAGTDPFSQVMGAVDLTGISVAVVAAAILIVGIAIAFKSPDVAKRVVKKV